MPVDLDFLVSAPPDKCPTSLIDAVCVASRQDSKRLWNLTLKPPLRCNLGLMLLFWFSPSSANPKYGANSWRKICFSVSVLPARTRHMWAGAGIISHVTHGAVDEPREGTDESVGPVLREHREI